MNVDIQKIREDFPILSRTVYGKPLVYFDNGATTQKPRLVVDSLVDEYYSVNANVHRGVHYLSQQATELHEASRETVREFINAHSTNEVVFTRGTTESINLLVSSFGDEFMEEGDEVIDTIRLDALKDRLHLLVEKRFRGELNRCQGCAICK